MWNKQFQLPDGSYSLSDIQDFFECIIKKDETATHNLQIKIYVNKIENRTTFKIKTWYYLKLLMLETMILLGSTKCKITKDENGEKCLRLDITEVISPL